MVHLPESARSVQGSNLRRREPDLGLATRPLTTRATLQAEGGGLEPHGVTRPRFSRPVTNHPAAPSNGCAVARPVSYVADELEHRAARRITVMVNAPDNGTRRQFLEHGARVPLSVAVWLRLVEVFPVDPVPVALFTGRMHIRRVRWWRRPGGRPARNGRDLLEAVVREESQPIGR